MKLVGKSVVLVLLSILAVSSLLSVAQAFTMLYRTKVCVDPGELKVQCGQAFQVYVNVCDVSGLQAFDFMLKYDSKIIDCVSVEEGTFLSSVGNTFVAKKEINNEFGCGWGRVWLAVAILGTPYANGSGILAVIRFNATAVGESVLDLYSDFPYEPDLVKLATCSSQAIPHNVVDGHVVVVCPSPPVDCKVTFLTCPVCSGFNITFNGVTYHNGTIGTFAYGTSGSATANCAADYVFDHWEVVGNVEVSSTTANPTCLTIKCGGTLKAVCRAVECPCACFTTKSHSPNVTFNASSSFDPDGRILSYTWDFGDGNTTIVEDPVIIHDYVAAGTYNVTLTVIDDDGLSHSAKRSLTIRMLAGDFNGDGIVNILDIAMVGRAFGSKLGEPNFNDVVDMDDNGIINIVDVAVVAKEFGRTA